MRDFMRILPATAELMAILALAGLMSAQTPAGTAAHAGAPEMLPGSPESTPFREPTGPPESAIPAKRSPPSGSAQFHIPTVRPQIRANRLPALGRVE